MGLDVFLYWFEGVDTDALVKLWQFSDEPWAYEQHNKADGHEKLASKARELGLPDSIFEDSVFGGNKTATISFPSTRHPEWPVGEWYSFSTVREMMEYFTGKNFYYVLPEAQGIHGLFRPDWAASKKRLAEILGELKNLTGEQIDDFHDRFVLAQISPVFLERWKSVPRATAAEIFQSCLAQIEVMIETLDFVLNSGNPREFLLYWSD